MNENYFTVSQLTKQIKIILEQTFFDVAVQGEISNFKRHTSGHMYFTLKDENASINAVMWRGRAINLFFTPQDGMKVIARGSVSVYEPRGTYQLDIVFMKPLGIGELQMAFEELKKKLASEGLFDSKYKKHLPEFPERIGIVTSPTGAVIRDIANIISRRFPLVELFLYPVNVQGPGAAEEIANAIEQFNKYKNIDVMIICRGGGSLEDLWAFNEEIVARAIFNSEIPIISAVGHETDFTISDFVADLRAPTPSAAAELVVPNTPEIIENIKNFIYTIKENAIDNVSLYKDSIKNMISNYYFNLPINNIKQFTQRIDEFDRLLNLLMDHSLNERKNNIKNLKQRISSLNPDSVLKRGYAIVYKNSHIIDRGYKLNLGDEVGLKFKDKKLNATIIKDK